VGVIFLFFAGFGVRVGVGFGVRVAVGLAVAVAVD
jgi:hypothetical protein